MRRQFKIRIYRDETEVDRLAVSVARPMRSGTLDPDAGRAQEGAQEPAPDQTDLVEVLPEIDVPRTVSGKPRYLLDERAGGEPAERM